MKSARLQLQPHASACRSYAARELDLSNTSQRRHYEKCQVATATACLGMPLLCCEKASLVSHKPAQALRKVPGCHCNRMPRHAAAMLRESWTCQAQASAGTMKSARSRLQPHASACRSYAARKLTCPTQASVGTMKRTRLQLQPHASACRSYAARKLDLSNTSQRRHYEKCQVATATACLGIPQLCCEKAGPVKHKPA